MRTNKSLSYVLRALTSSILLSPFVFLTPADAIPPGVPRDRCGTLSNPQPGTLCYTVTPGGGKVNAGSSDKAFPSIIIQATEPEYVIADVIVEITSDAGDRNLPSVSQLSPGGQASIVSVARDKLRELKQIRGELQAKATVLSGPALIEAQAKLSALQEQERIYENVVTTTTAAGQDAGKFQVGGASARSRSCGTLNLDTCGSWVEYNVYAVKRYVGNPIAAYNRAFAVAQDAQNTINRLVAANQQTSAANQQTSAANQQASDQSSWAAVAQAVLTAVDRSRVPNQQAPAQSSWAAIARSDHDARFGMFWSAATKEEAESRAIQNCAASDCRVLVWANNSFLAIAQSNDQHWGVAWGRTDDEAQQFALESCRKVSINPDTCHITFKTSADGQHQITGVGG